MLIKFKARQKLKTMLSEYRAWLENDGHLTAEECEEIIDVIVALETVVDYLKEDNE